MSSTAESAAAPRRLIRVSRAAHRVGGGRHDVVFYTPRIGSVLTGGPSLPPGGAETQILMLAKALVERGLRVAIIVYGSKSELPASVDGVALITRPPYRKRGAIVGKVVEMWHVWMSLARARSRTVVNRCSGMELGLIAVYTKLTGRRLVFSTASVVDFECNRLMAKLSGRLLYELGVRWTDAIVVQTQEQVELCQSTFARSSTLIKSMSERVPRQTVEPEAFLWVGRLVSYKQPLRYLELARALPDIPFWMVGVPVPHTACDRELAERAMAIAADTPNLTMLPPRSHAEIGELMARAVASVNTADFEGMPNVLLEAWSRGVPALVLTHDPGGVVRTHGLGDFAEGSMDRLVALAAEQWANRSARTQLAERCRDYMATHHDPAVVAGQWVQIISAHPAVDAEHEALVPQ
jgi:glycosyltransferase involved in cell wall biosynthesis